MWNLCLGLGSVTARVCDLGHVTSHFWAWIASKAGELGLCHYNFRSNFKFKKKYFFADMMMECLMSTATCLQGNFIWTREPVIGGGIWASVREMSWPEVTFPHVTHISGKENSFACLWVLSLSVLATTGTSTQNQWLSVNLRGHVSCWQREAFLL